MTVPVNFDALDFKGCNNGKVSLNILAEHVGMSNVRIDGAELQRGEVRDYLTVTLSVQKRR